MDQYAAALGFGSSAPPPVSDPYAAALGFAPRASAPKGSAKAGSGVLSPEDQARSDAYERDPSVAAELQREVARASPARRAILSDPNSNGTALVAAAPQSTAGAGRGTMPASAYVQPQEMVTGAAAIPGYQAPAPAAPEPKWWEKVVGGHEAALSALTGLTSGMLGGIAGGAKALVTGQDPGQGFTEGAQALTYSPRTASGQEQAGTIGDAMSYYGPSLIAIGPELGAAGEVISNAARPAGAAAGRSFQAMQDAFAAKKAAAPVRVDPTISGAPPVVATPDPALLKPRYQMVDGQPVMVGSTPPPAATFTPPALADAPPPLQKAIADTGTAGTPAAAAHVEASTLRVPGRLTAGQALGDPALISDEMNGRGKIAPSVMPDFYKQQGQTVAANLEANRVAAAPDIPTTASMADHDQIVLDAYKQKNAAAQTAIGADYQALKDAQPGNVFLNGSDVKSAVASALDTSEAHRSSFLPSALQTAISSLPDDMSLARFESLRTQLATAARSTAAQQDGNVMGAINAARSAVESLPMPNAAGPIKALADKARASARAQFQAVEADPAYSAAVNDSVPLGIPSPLAGNFVKNYALRPAAPRANVATMAQNLADNPQAAQALRAATVDHVNAAMKADGAGNFSQSGYNKTLGSLSDKLPMLVDPATAYYMQATGNFAKNAQIQPRGAYVSNSNTAPALLADMAKNGAANLADIHLFGGAPVVSTASRVASKVMAGRAANKAAANAVEPGAGLTRLSEFPR